MTVRHTAFEAIGTHWDMRVKCQLNNDEWFSLLERIYARIQAFDKAYSRFRSDSLVTRMAQKAGSYELPSDGYKLLHFYKQLYAATNGKVTPLIGQTIADAGYDATYSFSPKKLQRPPAWEETVSFSCSAITMNKPALLDFGSAGKGYLVDIVAELLAGEQMDTFTINAGGDILYRTADGNSLSVGLENPFDISEAVGVAQLHNQSMCASSGSKRQWAHFHHVVDPDTLSSPTEIAGTWVIADDTMTADGIATALFFSNPSALGQHFAFTFAILHKDMTLTCAKDFPIKIFKAEAYEKN